MLVYRRRLWANIEPTLTPWVNVSCFLGNYIVWLLSSFCWSGGPGAAACFEVRDRGFEPLPGFQVSNQVSRKQNASFLLTRTDSILWRAAVTKK